MALTKLTSVDKSVAKKLLSELPIQVSTVAEMKTKSYEVGQVVETVGYYAEGDSGAAKYLVKAAQAFDGYGDHELANGNIAVLQSNRHLKLSQYGVLTSGDMQPNANAALNKLQTGEKLEFDVAELTIHSTILREDMPDNTHIDLGNCIIHPDTPAMADQRMLALTGVQEDHGTMEIILRQYLLLPTYTHLELNVSELLMLQASKQVIEFSFTLLVTLI